MYAFILMTAGKTKLAHKLSGKSHFAIRKDKAILDTGQPDRISYKPHFLSFMEHMAPEAKRDQLSQELTVTQTYSPYCLHHPGGVGEELDPKTIFHILAPRTSLYHCHHPKTMYQIPKFTRSHSSTHRESSWEAALRASLSLRNLSPSHPSSLHLRPRTPIRWPRSKLLSGLHPMTLHCGNRMEKADNISQGGRRREGRRGR